MEKPFDVDADSDEKLVSPSAHRLARGKSRNIARKELSRQLATTIVSALHSLNEFSAAPLDSEKSSRFHQQSQSSAFHCGEK